MTLAVVQLTRPPVYSPNGQLKRQLFTSDQRPFWGTVIQYNAFGTLQQTSAVLLCFSFSCFKVILAPRPHVSDLCVRCSPNGNLIKLWPTEQFDNSNNGYIWCTIYVYCIWMCVCASHTGLHTHTSQSSL